MQSSSANVSSAVASNVPSRTPAAVALSMQMDFAVHWYDEPWAYTKAQAAFVTEKGSLDAEGFWEASSHLMYAHIDSTPKGITVHRKSVVTGAYEDVKLESAHLIGARRFTRTAMGKKGAARSVVDFAGQAAIKWLIDANVIPNFADINCDSNRILLEHRYHTALDDRRLRLVPCADLVLVRLISEITYQEKRLAATIPQKRGPPDDPQREMPPVRPSFNEFYEDLEKMGAVFRLFGTIELQHPIIVRTIRKAESFKVEGLDLDSDLRAMLPNRAEPADVADSEYPVFPPLRVPCSTNCLIYAVKDSVEVGPPASFEVYDETRRLQGIVQLLVCFWFLKDNSTEADIRRLIERSRQSIATDYPGTFWAKSLDNLGSFTYADLASNVALPANVIDTRTPRPPAQQRVVAQDLDLHEDEPIRVNNIVGGDRDEDEIMPLSAASLRQHDAASLPSLLYTDPSTPTGSSPSCPGIRLAPPITDSLSPKADILQQYLRDKSYMFDLDVSKPIR